MKALDLFCGLGGWSDGLAIEGFDVLGVEIIPRIAKLYKHKVMVADVRDLKGEDFKGYDLIVGSPPCRDFTSIGRIARNWKIPQNPKNGLIFVNAFLQFVKDAEPSYWLMENVPNLANHLPLKATQSTWLKPNMRRCFWGNYPAFLTPRIEQFVSVQSQTTRELRSWKSARIPLPVARALGKAVRDAMDSARATRNSLDNSFIQ